MSLFSHVSLKVRIVTGLIEEEETEISENVNFRYKASDVEVSNCYR